LEQLWKAFHNPPIATQTPLLESTKECNPVPFHRPARLTAKADHPTSLFRAYAHRAGLSIRNVHSLRHSIAIHLLEAGRGIEYVADHLGHKNIRNTRVYAQITNPLREQVFRELEQHPKYGFICYHLSWYACNWSHALGNGADCWEEQRQVTRSARHTPHITPPIAGAGFCTSLLSFP
jgi:hypothetical protein